LGGVGRGCVRGRGVEGEEWFGAVGSARRVALSGEWGWGFLVFPVTFACDRSASVGHAEGCRAVDGGSRDAGCVAMGRGGVLRRPGGANALRGVLSIVSVNRDAGCPFAGPILREMEYWMCLRGGGSGGCRGCGELGRSWQFGYGLSSHATSPGTLAAGPWVVLGGPGPGVVGLRVLQTCTGRCRSSGGRRTVVPGRSCWRA